MWECIVALLTSIACFYFMPRAFAMEEEVQIVEGIKCMQGHDIRQLEILTKEAGCTLQYSKFGKNSQIALSRHGVEVCKDRLKQVRNTLEGSGYQCK